MSVVIISRRTFVASALALPLRSAPLIGLQRVPENGLQPRVVVDSAATVHLIYFQGDALTGDLVHAESKPGGRTFETRGRVNRTPRSAIATGTVRGAQLTLGRNNRLHVAWNGSKDAEPKGPDGQTPMLYTRSDGRGGFEPERNVIQSAYGLDGGGTLASDRDGTVYVFWHAPKPGEKGEEHRQIWMVRSQDDGASFADERVVSNGATGACGCCGMGAWAGTGGRVYALYRSARETVHRDMYLLASSDRGRTFSSDVVGRWEVGYCVMSTEAFNGDLNDAYAAWETKGQIWFGRISDRVSPIAAPGEPNGRKHPSLAVTSTHVLLVWTEGTGWKRGGSVCWQLYSRRGAGLEPIPEERGQMAGLPAFSFAAAYAHPNGGFQIVF